MSQSYNVIGYGVCGGGESKRYLEATLKQFQKFCDHTVIVGNNLTDDDKEMILKYGFELLGDIS